MDEDDGHPTREEIFQAIIAQGSSGVEQMRVWITSGQLNVTANPSSPFQNAGLGVWQNGPMGPPLWQNGNEMLILAVAHNKPGVVKLLLQEGAPMEQCFSICVSTGRIQMVKVLVEHGCNPSSTSIFGDGPLHRLIVMDNSWPSALFAYLIQVGCDINQKCPHGKTPFHKAVSYACSDHPFYLPSVSEHLYLRLRFLLMSNCRLDTIANNGMTPVHELVHGITTSNYRSVKERILRMIIKSGVDIMSILNTPTPNFVMDEYDLMAVPDIIKRRHLHSLEVTIKEKDKKKFEAILSSLASGPLTEIICYSSMF